MSSFFSRKYIYENWWWGRRSIVSPCENTHIQMEKLQNTSSNIPSYYNTLLISLSGLFGYEFYIYLISQSDVDRLLKNFVPKGGCAVIYGLYDLISLLFTFSKANKLTDHFYWKTEYSQIHCLKGEFCFIML